jgi:predicted TIM-barrel fold metal-dependent hydrolase
MTDQHPYAGGRHRSLDDLKAWTDRSTEEAIDPTIPIVDAHHHLYEDERGRYLFHDMLADLMCGHDIRATVFLEARAMYRATGPLPLRPIGETEFAVGMGAMADSGHYGKTRICAAIVGFADLTLGEAVQDVLDEHLEAGRGRFRGIRHPAQWDEAVNQHLAFLPPRHLLADSGFRAGFARLAPRGLCYEAWQFYPQLAELLDLARSFPETSIVVNHVGGILGVNQHANRRDEIFEHWRTSIRALARCPNVTIKLGGLGMLSCGFDFHRGKAPPDSTSLATAWRPYFETCVEAFGAARCMFESNFPPDKQSCAYGTMWNAFKLIARPFTRDERTMLFSGTACRVYQLSI